MCRPARKGFALFVLGLLLGAFRSWGFDQSDPVRLSLHLRINGISANDAHPPVRVNAVWYGRGAMEPRSAPLSSAAPGSIELPPGRWSLQAEAPGFWGEAEYLEIDRKSEETTLNLWPAGTVEGGFLLPRGERLPKELAAFFRPLPGAATAASPPPSKVLCPVSDKAWRCVLPAGRYDLRFQVDGFIPRYQWGVMVERGKTATLGRFELARGSAVLGWVVTSDRSRIAEGTRVEIRPRMGGEIRQESEAGRVQSLNFTAPVNDRGFFQVDGVPPGAYVVEVKQAPFAPAAATVRVLAGETTEIANPPLILDFPKALEVFLTPPVDPQGEPWRIQLSQLDRSTRIMSASDASVVDAAGSWTKSGLAKGSYLLRVQSEAGDSWLTQEVEIDDNPAPLHLDLPVVKVAGVVRWGKSPLPATLIFGGRFGATRITARADEEGHFELYLPKPGKWPVFISSEVPPVVRELAGVRIEPRPGKDTAEVDLVLPDTELLGRVVDEAGKAVAKAIVSVKSEDDPEPVVQDWADDEGRFSFVGLPAGKLLVSADGGEERFSDLVPVRVEEGSRQAELKLVVRAQLRISGTLVSPSGPVVGARIKAAPVGVPHLGVRTVTSGAQGRFEVVLAPNAKEMFLAVGAPGFAFRTLRLPVPEDRHLTLGVDQSGGTLRLEFAEPLANPAEDGPIVFLFHRGSVEGLPLFVSWAVSSGVLPDDPAVAVVPAVEPGDYRACWVLPAERAGIDYGIVPPGRCAEGALTANGELRLSLPARPKGKSGAEAP